MSKKNDLNSDYDQSDCKKVRFPKTASTVQQVHPITNFLMKRLFYQFPNIFSDLFFCFEVQHETITFDYIDWNCTVYPAAGKYQRWMYRCGGRNVTQSFCTNSSMYDFSNLPIGGTKTCQKKWGCFYSCHEWTLIMEMFESLLSELGFHFGLGSVSSISTFHGICESLFNRRRPS